MCGINGFNFLDKNKIQKMMTLTENRGPDAKGIFESENMTLGHNRLSIIDLSTAANQPLTDDNLTIIFNGEIYNYIEIKKFLMSKGYKFVTNSDTEVLLNSYIHFGDNFTEELNGMFSFAL